MGSLCSAAIELTPELRSKPEDYSYWAVTLQMVFVKYRGCHPRIQPQNYGMSELTWLCELCFKGAGGVFNFENLGPGKIVKK